jgi:Zn-dependent alcohol dehydrogenase
VDKVQSRLDLAKELGATHEINTASLGSLAEIGAKVKQITGGLGATIVMDTTGFLPLVEQGLKAVANCGKFLQVGVPPPGGEAKIPMLDFISFGKSFIGVAGGDTIPTQYVPRMIQWWKQGKFPLEKLVRYFKAESFQEVIESMISGETVKPVLVW